jgi:diacylglycerol kinase family enzyme
MRRRRLAALAALTLGLAALAMIVALAVVDLRRGMPALALLACAAALAWYGRQRRGTSRVIAFGAGALLLAGYVALLVARSPGLVLGLVATVGFGLTAGGHALRSTATRPPAPRPRRAVLFYNPRSGGGKAAHFRLADEARARGIEPIELSPGADLAQLVQQAVDEGADALAMAGGDGSQAVVAAIAAERRLPYACIPAGTRNHFALDLGVDRDDVVGALDALVDGRERIVDVGEVNGRTFVNNVSLGWYGEAVQRTTYRNAKVRTLLETVPAVLGPAVKTDLRWQGPAGDAHDGPIAMMVSNNAYRFEAGPGAGTRPQLDRGVLGVAVLGSPEDDVGLLAWSTPSFTIEAQAPVPAGVDGEAVMLDPPLRFSVRSGALRCRVASHHPGVSPSAFAPEGLPAAVRALFAVAAGHQSPWPARPAHG